MESGEWYREKEEAQYAYEHDLIDRDIYELRTKTAIGMIYKCGNAKDKKSAKKMAEAHGYDIKELIKLVN